MPRRARRILSRTGLLPLLVAAALSAGCGGSTRPTPSSTLRGEDNGVRTPVLRASFNLRRQRPDPRARTPEGAEYSVPLALDVEYSRADAEPDDAIGAGQVVRFGDPRVELVGPATIEADARLEQLSIAVRSGFLFQSGIAVEGFVGLERSELDMVLRSGGTNASDRVIGYGPLAGARLSYWIDESFGLYGSLSEHYAIPRRYDDLVLDVFELGLRWWFKAPLGLFAGWRWVEYEVTEDSDSGRSDIDFDLEGPFFGLQASF